MNLMAMTSMLAALLISCGQQNKSEITAEALPGSTETTSAPEAEVPYSSPTAETAGTSLLTHFKFASTVSADKKAYIEYDLKNLANWTDATRPTQLAKLGAVTGLAEVNATTLSQWFMDRMTYIYPDDGGDFNFAVVVPSERRVYSTSFAGNGSSSIAGANMGAAMFSYYQSVHASGVDGIMLKFDTDLVPFLSPRTGAMKIGPALFGVDDTLDTTKSESHRLVKSIFRLNVLLHESRHSDGNEAHGSFGFSHVNCPSDGSVAPELAGQPACDSYANGAYAVSATSIGALTGICDGVCSARDLAALESVRLDMLSRILVADDAANYGDATPETALTALDTSLFELMP